MELNNKDNILWKSVYIFIIWNTKPSCE